MRSEFAMVKPMLAVVTQFERSPVPDIPIVVCQACRKQPMVIKSIVPHLRSRDGVDVEYFCPRCRVVEKTTLKQD